MDNEKLMGMDRDELRIEIKKCQMRKLAGEIMDMEAGINQKVNDRLVVGWLAPDGTFTPGDNYKNLTLADIERARKDMVFKGD